MSHAALIAELEAVVGCGLCADLMKRVAAALRDSQLKVITTNCPNGCQSGIEGKFDMNGFERMRCLRCDARWLP